MKRLQKPLAVYARLLIVCAVLLAVFLFGFLAGHEPPKREVPVSNRLLVGGELYTILAPDQTAAELAQFAAALPDGTSAPSREELLPDNLEYLSAARHVSAEPQAELECSGDARYDGAPVWRSEANPSYLWIRVGDTTYCARSEWFDKEWFYYESSRFLQLKHIAPDAAAATLADFDTALLDWEQDDWTDFLAEAQTSGQATCVGTLGAIFIDYPTSALTVHVDQAFLTDRYEGAPVWQLPDHPDLLLVVCTDGEIEPFWRCGR